MERCPHACLRGRLGPSARIPTCPTRVRAASATRTEWHYDGTPLSACRRPLSGTGARPRAGRKDLADGLLDVAARATSSSAPPCPSWRRAAGCCAGRSSATATTPRRTRKCPSMVSVHCVLPCLHRASPRMTALSALLVAACSARRTAAPSTRPGTSGRWTSTASSPSRSCTRCRSTGGSAPSRSSPPRTPCSWSTKATVRRRPSSACSTSSPSCRPTSSTSRPR